MVLVLVLLVIPLIHPMIPLLVVVVSASDGVYTWC